MSALDQIAEQAIANLDAEDAGLEANNEDEGTQDGKETTDAKDVNTDKSKSGEATNKSGDSDASKSEEGKKSSDKAAKTDEVEEEGTFTADDALETEEQEQAPAAPVDNAGIILSPAEQKYVVDNIGEPLTLNGYKANKDGELESYSVKAYDMSTVPKDFKFGSEIEMAQAIRAFDRLEAKATELLGNYRQTQSNTAAQDFERRENEGIRSDLADLQKQGRFPKFKVQPGAAGFDDTAEAKQFAEIVELMTERNDTYIKQYNQGRPYKHIGFEEAFELWEKNNPAKQEEAKTNKAQEDEDKARKGKAEHSDSNRGMTTNLQKPTVRPGQSMRDLINRIDLED